MFKSAAARKEDRAWAEWCVYWLDSPGTKRRPGRAPRQVHEPFLLTGHGIRLRVDNGALLVRDRFPHYPHELDDRRYFPGDRRKPSRIIVVDGSGGLNDAFCEVARE
jgi:hypothetical protein